MTSIGERIREARKGLDLTQTQLAERVGLTQSAIANFETGGNGPSVGNLKAMALALGVSTDLLIFGVEEPERPRSPVTEPAA